MWVIDSKLKWAWTVTKELQDINKINKKKNYAITESLLV